MVLSTNGERVFGMAYKRLPKSEYDENYKFSNKSGNIDKKYNFELPNFPIDDLCFIGLVGIEDPPRDGVKEAISICKNAGIKVIMVTGD